MSDSNKKRKIQTESKITYPASNKTVITRTYENGTKEIETKTSNPQDWLKGGGYNPTRSKRKKQSSEDDNLENK